LGLGAVLTEDIREAIESSWHFVVVLSEASLASDWVAKETAAALELGRVSDHAPRILPVLLDLEPDATQGTTLSDVVGERLCFPFDGAAAFDVSFKRLWRELLHSLRLEVGERVAEHRPLFRAGPLAAYGNGFALSLTGAEPAWCGAADDVVFVRHLELHRTTARGLASEIVDEYALLSGPLSGDGSARPSRLHHPLVAPDGSFVAFWQTADSDEFVITNAELIVVDLSTGDEVARRDSQTRIADGYIDGGKMAWSPTGRRLAYITPSGHPALLTPGLEQDRTATDLSATETVSWSPNGDQLVCAHGGGGVHTIRVLGRELEQVGADRELTGSHVRWLDDDELLMIGGGAGQYELATIDPGTMKRRRVLSRSDEYRYFEVAAGSNAIAYWEPTDDGTELRVHDLESHTVLTLARWEHGTAERREYPHPLPPRWHPSGRRVLVGVDDQMVVFEVPL
ncbi:MAG: TIR domain-containing protein, partial [Actinomycetota bacterium]